MAIKNLIIFILLLSLKTCLEKGAIGSKEMVPVGVILDLNSTEGKMAKSYISMALTDFYSINDNYRTRLALYVKDSRKDVVHAASAALELINKEEVYAIIGPQRSSQAKFVIDVGEKAQVPIISFSATSPSLSTTQKTFFIRTAQDDQSQVKAIKSIVQAYGWRKVILIYEDTEYGNGLIPYLTDAFQQIATQVPERCVIPPSSSGLTILKKLNMLMTRQTRVFVVHMTASLGSKFFQLVKAAGMMNEGYAWIITDGLSALLDPTKAKVTSSMQGVLGVRPYIPKSRRLKDFEVKWKNINKPNSTTSDLNLFGLWAYDTIWALAMAAEKVGPVDSNISKQNTSRSSSDILGIRVSEVGPRLLNVLSHSRFKGLGGNFQLLNGQLQPYAFEIINVIGKEEKVIGYWTPKKGITRELGVYGKASNSTSMDVLETPIWPGNTKEKPKGWVIPVNGKKLKIGVPVKSGFQEFLKVEWNIHTNEPIVSGFCHDVFLAALETLPFAVPYEYIPFMNSSRQSAGSYDKLLYKIKLQEFDAVVGDTTIVADRSLYVDFSLPYIESGVTMLVKVKDDERKNIWIFLKPLSWDLWLTTGAAFMFTGLVVWVLEHRTNTEFRGPPDQQLGIIFWFSFSTLVFAHRERITTNLSRFVLIIWIFVVLILTQSYTASLASMLTVQRMEPAVVDINELRKNGDCVGYLTGSFVKELLIKQFKFEESRLRDYSSPEKYHEALTRGCHNGGVAAIFDELPYIKLFLAKYCAKYTTVGPTYKTDGFGFAFPQGSPLVSYISRAILNVTQDRDKMGAIELKYFTPETTCQDSTISSDSLSVYSFAGLFIITGVASMSSLVIYIFKFFYLHWPASNAIHRESSFLGRVMEMARYFDQKDLPSQAFMTSESNLPSVRTSAEGVEASPSGNNLQNRFKVFQPTRGEHFIDEEDETHSTKN